jgi:hypothetical protein
MNQNIYYNARFTQKNILNKDNLNSDNCIKINNISNFENKNFIGRGSEANVYTGKNSNHIIRVVKLSSNVTIKKQFIRSLFKEAHFQNETNNNRFAQMSPYVYDIFTCKNKAYVIQERMTGTLTNLFENIILNSNSSNISISKLDKMISDLIIKSKKTKLCIQDFHFNNIVYQNNELFYIDWNTINGYTNEENLFINIYKNVSSLVISLLESKHTYKMKKTLPMFRKRQIIPNIFFLLAKEIKDVELLLKSSNSGMKGIIPAMQLAALNNIVTWNNENNIDELTRKLIEKRNKLKKSRYNKTKKLYVGQQYDVNKIKDHIFKNISNKNKQKQVWRSYVKLAEIINSLGDLRELLTKFKQHNEIQETYNNSIKNDYELIMNKFVVCNKMFQKYNILENINNVFRLR